MEAVASTATAARLWPRLVFAALVALLQTVLVPSTAHAAAAWPSSWTPYSFADGSPIQDVAGDVNPGYSDITSVGGTLPSVYVATDGTNVFFRIRVAADPEVNRGGSFNSNVWLVQIAVAGVHRASVGLDGKPAGVNDIVYVTNPGETATSVPYNPVVPNGGASGGGRVVANGPGGYFVDFQLPISSITTIAPQIGPSTPVQLFFGSSTSNSNINKDYMVGTAVSFVGLGTIALDGTPVGDTSTTVSITSPAATADPTPTIAGTGEVGASIEVVVAGQTLTTTVAADGSWSVDVPLALVDGDYAVSVTATDGAGNSATASQTLTVDTATAVAVTSPAATADPTPTIAGTGEVGASIEVVVAGQTLTTTVAADGSWSVDVPLALADGDYAVTVTATDALGNTAAVSRTLTVDTATSVIVTSPNLTNDSTPTLAGTGEVGASIEVVVAGQTLTTTVAADGSWSVEVPVGLADGVYPVAVTATDALGNTATASRIVTVDTVTTVAVVSPTVTDNPTPTLSGTGEPGASIDLTVDGQVLSGVVDGSGSWSITVPVALADGSYAVTATATDVAGNTSLDGATLVVDTRTTVAVTSSNLTTDPTPTISGTGEPGAGVAVTVDGQSLTATVAVDGSWSVTVPAALADATYSVAVSAVDALGNVASTTHALTVDATTSVAITSDAFTSDSTPTIRGTGEPASIVVVTVAGQVLSGVVDGSGSWSVTVPVGLTDATYPMVVTATDLAGNTATDTQDLTVDATTFVRITSPPLIGSSTPTIEGEAEPNAEIVVKIGSETLTTTAGLDGTWAVTATIPLADGTYLVPVTATVADVVGNSATTSQNLTIDTVTTVAITSPAVTTDPTPSISGAGEPGATVAVTVADQSLSAVVGPTGSWSIAVPVALADGTYAVSVTATDLIGSTATDTQSLLVDTQTVVTLTSPSATRDATPTIAGIGEPGASIEVVVAGQTMTTTVPVGGSWSVTVPVALADGTHPVAVTATDALGNTATATQNLTVDTATTVAISSPPETADSTPTVAGTAEAGASVVAVVAGQTLTTTAAPDGTWSVTVPVALADGTHPVAVTATDALGNTATATQNLTVDTATTVAVTSPILTTDSTPTVTGTGEADASVEVDVAGQTLTTTAAPDGSWSVTVPVALADGTHPVTVTATDALGNTATAGQTLVVDTTAFGVVTSPTLGNDPTPTIAGTGEPGATVTVRIVGVTLTAIVGTDTSWSVTVPTTLVDGPYSAQVTVVDAAGNSTSFPHAIVIDTVAELEAPAVGPTNDPTPTFSGTGEPGTTVVVMVAGRSLTTTVGADGTWSVTSAEELADGTYAVTVGVEDEAGNTTTASWDLVVDTVAVLGDTAPTASGVAISGTGEPGATVTVTVGGVPVETLVGADGIWSVPIPAGTAAGAQLVRVRIRDLLGNVAETSWTVTIPRVPSGALPVSGAATNSLFRIGLFLAVAGMVLRGLGNSDRRRRAD